MSALAKTTGWLCTPVGKAKYEVGTNMQDITLEISIMKLFK